MVGGTVEKWNHQHLVVEEPVWWARGDVAPFQKEVDFGQYLFYISVISIYLWILLKALNQDVKSGNF